jgi:hypothetical protein
VVRRITSGHRGRPKADDRSIAERNRSQLFLRSDVASVDGESGSAPQAERGCEVGDRRCRVRPASHDISRVATRHPKKSLTHVSIFQYVSAFFNSCGVDPGQETNMTMLGAQLDDLDALGQRLRTTAGEIGDVRSAASATAGRVVGEVRAAAEGARRDIGQAMAALRSAVSASATAADATAWSGANHDRFLDAHRDFDGAMASAEEATTSAFTEFGAAIDRMAAGLEEYATRLATSLDQANEASASMAAAVEQQRMNLDQVMNQGLGLG